MSLAVLADHMASKGRGPDSMLIHMSPREVQGLQALAEHHGGTLTINPDTGLPEANFLEKLLPTIIGAGISYFSGGTIDPMTAAAMVGGVETARTGDIGRGISAGFQAYGGANLTSNLSEMGSAAIGAESAASGLTMSPELLAEFGGDLERGISAKDLMLQQQVTDRMAAATPFEKLSYGAEAFKNNPLASLKANAMPIAGAFGPAILAEMSAKSNMPQTVTKPGMIAPYASFGGQFVAGTPYQATPTKAAGGGLMGMDDGGYGPGMLDFTQRSEPVVRMASGGVPGYAGATGSVVDGSKFDQATINAALATELADMAKTGRNTSQADLSAYAKSQYGLTDAQINAAYDTIPGFNAQGKYDAADYMATSKPGQVSPQMVVDAAAAANPYSAQNMAKVDITRPGQYVQDASGNYVTLSANSPGFNANNPTALTYLGELAAGGGQDSTSQAFNQIATPAQKAEADRLWTAEKARLEAIDRAAGRLPALDAGTNANVNKGLAGLNQNQNLLTNQNLNLTNQNKNAGLPALIPDSASYTNRFFAERGLGFDPIDKSIENFLATYKTQLASMTPEQQTAAMTDALAKERMNEADVIQATGLTIAQLVQAKRADGSIIVPGKLDEVPVGSLPGGVSGAGNTVVNANGTITTKPDFSLPMKDVRDTYVEGGGSLGYTSPTFDSLKAVEEKYPLRGAAKKSYDYLMGREDYDPIPYTKDGQISKSYAGSVMKVPRASANQMYIFKNGRFEPNPEYAIPTYDKDGKKSLNLTNADVKAFMNTKPSADAFYTWATTNNLSPEQIALASDRPINEISKLFTGAKDLVGEDGKIDQTKVDAKTEEDFKTNFDHVAYLKANPDVQAELDAGKANFGTKDDLAAAAYEHYQRYGKAQKRPLKAAGGGLMAMAGGGMAQQFNLGDYSDGGRLLRGPGDGISDSIPATIGGKRPARLADGEFVVPARIVSELGNGSTEAGARKLYAMMDRVQKARRGTVGKGRVAKNSRSEKYLPA